MIADQCVSITDLRRDTKKLLKNIKKGPRYIFSKNKPIAVLMTIDTYEVMQSTPHLIPLRKEDISREQEKRLQETEAMDESAFDNL